MNKLKKLPIGIQTFSEIREDNYLYIDKTDIAYEILDNYKYVFLSRPRRFGKSLFLDTLRNIFEGKEEYFKDLAIYILEFKVDDKEDALQQIKEKKYVTKYLNEKKDLYLIGISFDTKEKNISNFEWEKYNV